MEAQDWERHDVSPVNDRPVYVIVRRSRVMALQEVLSEVAALLYALASSARRHSCKLDNHAVTIKHLRMAGRTRMLCVKDASLPCRLGTQWYPHRYGQAMGSALILRPSAAGSGSKVSRYAVASHM